MYRNYIIFAFLFFVCINNGLCQDIDLFQQFNGRYDYTAIGNTLNPEENNIVRDFCEILPESEAQLTINSSHTIVAAYLYWAGSGAGDLEINFNNQTINAEETYTIDYEDPNYGTLTYFSCVANVSNYVISRGNGIYEFSGLDISDTLSSNSGYCNNRTNFAGWSLYVIYEDSSLPINQINIFQGLEIINRNIQEKVILLEDINVLDNIGAKIGFLAWEGDSLLNYGESLLINNNLLSNPPLNPSDNAFNGTNSFTNSNTFYNCDLDVYNIQNNIAIGDTSVEIKLTTGGFDSNGIFQADLIILNNIITVLNIQLPDATISINDTTVFCNNRDVEVDYTVSNFNSTDILPNNAPIAFYANSELIAQSYTQNTLNVGASESNTIQITIPENIPLDFTLTAVIDDDGTGVGIVTELNELNNTSQNDVSLIPFPEVIDLPDLSNCDEGFDSAHFDLTHLLNSINYDTNFNVSYYTTLEDLYNDNNEILTPTNYKNTQNQQYIHIKIENSICFDIFRSKLIVKNCPPYIPEVFTPNNDGYNDWFNIQGLYNIFENHKLLIYNRYGTLIFEGNNTLPWQGKANKGLNNKGKILPVGTYYYILHLNDSNYKPMTGWVYLNK